MLLKSKIKRNIVSFYSLNRKKDNIRFLIEKHFIPSMEEKKKNAEIPTPVKLVNEMLETIPSSYWTSLHKTLEPCCGKGNFVLGIFDLFFKGLRRKYREKEERCRVIIEECLYYCDISPINVFITTELLKCHVEMYCGKRLNIKFHSYVGDTLKLNPEKEWKVKGFDAVIGNPPYQKKVGIKKTEPIWNLFIEKYISLLENDGYLVFVTPFGWRDVKGRFEKIKDLMINKNLLYLNMNDYKEGRKVFHCGTNFDYFLLQNNNNYKETEINDIDKKEYRFNLRKWEFIPSGKLNIYKKLIAKPNEPKCEILSDSTYHTTKEKSGLLSKMKSKKFKYPCIYIITRKDGIKLLYSSEKKGHFGIPKIIWSNGGGTYPIVD